MKDERVTNDQSDEALRAIANRHARHAVAPGNTLPADSMLEAQNIKRAEEVIFYALKDAARLFSSSSGVEPLTDEEICKAWTNAVPASKDMGVEMYLHLMRAIAKAQRDKVSFSARTGGNDEPKVR